MEPTLNQQLWHVLNSNPDMAMDSAKLLAKSQLRDLVPFFVPDTQAHYLTVKELKAAIANLADDTPVVIDSVARRGSSRLVTEHTVVFEQGVSPEFNVEADAILAFQAFSTIETSSSKQVLYITTDY